MGAGHYKMALKACTRDRRWEAASALLHRVPQAMWEADVALCRNGLKACADAAEPQLAARHPSVTLTSPQRYPNVTLALP